jgi:hypothetical protein
MKNQKLLIGAGVVVVGYLLYKKMKNKKIIVAPVKTAPKIEGTSADAIANPKIYLGGK